MRKPSEHRSGISTLLANQDAPYARLLGEFRHCGFTLTQLKRVRAVAVYKQAKNEQAPAFEVVIIRRREASFAFGKDFPATEYYPHDEDWGTYGFTYRTLEEALAKAETIIGETARTGEQPWARISALDGAICQQRKTRLVDGAWASRGMGAMKNSESKKRTARHKSERLLENKTKMTTPVKKRVNGTTSPLDSLVAGPKARAENEREFLKR
jgi:hypothetical protein